LTAVRSRTCCRSCTMEGTDSWRCTPLWCMLLMMMLFNLRHSVIIMKSPLIVTVFVVYKGLCVSSHTPWARKKECHIYIYNNFGNWADYSCASAQNSHTERCNSHERLSVSQSVCLSRAGIMSKQTQAMITKSLLTHSAGTVSFERW